MSNFFLELDKPQMRSHQAGQILWVPAPIICKDALGVRLGFLKEGQDITTVPLVIQRLNPKDIGKASEAEKTEFHKRMPLPEINLNASEDLIIQKVKMRPAILLFKDAVNIRRFARFQSGITPEPNPNHYIFAPIYSLRKQDNIEHDYPDKFIEDVKNGVYPHLLHLSAYKTHLPNESMAVLNDLFGAGIQAFKETPLAIEPLELASKLEEFFEYVQGEMLLEADLA